MPYNIGLYPSVQLSGLNETLTNYWSDINVKKTDFQMWLGNMKGWRSEQHNRAGYIETEYNRPELLWSRQNIIQTKVIFSNPFFTTPLLDAIL